MLVLGIESSCDETAAAVVENARTVRSSVVSSQIAIHKPFGGVVPELASRHHVRNIAPVVREALDQAGVMLSDLGGIAVTRGPGLVGSLLVGVQFAKSIAYVCDTPLVGVNHLEGHLYASHLNETVPPADRHLALLVSGGHTMLILVEAFGQYRLIGTTRDDAAGEAFDKVAKLLGLGYPGGPIVEQHARDGNPHAIAFPRALPRKTEYDFSFSGLKTAVANHVRKRGVPQGSDLSDLCASFQQAVTDVLVKKTLRAAQERRVDTVVATGGVLANKAIRAAMSDAMASVEINLCLPPLAYCTDNGAMIAVAGTYRLERGDRSGFDLNAVARLPLTDRDAVA